MSAVPKEIEIYGVYFPPLLIAATLGLLAAWATANLFNRLGISRAFAFPPIVFFSLIVLYSCLIGTFLFRI